MWTNILCQNIERIAAGRIQSVTAIDKGRSQDVYSRGPSMSEEGLTLSIEPVVDKTVALKDRGRCPAEVVVSEGPAPITNPATSRHAEM